MSILACPMCSYLNDTDRHDECTKCGAELQTEYLQVKVERIDDLVKAARAVVNSRGDEAAIRALARAVAIMENSLLKNSNHTVL